jgi:hypothetical protein
MSIFGTSVRTTMVDSKSFKKESFAGMKCGSPTQKSFNIERVFDGTHQHASLRIQLSSYDLNPVGLLSVKML